MKLTQKKRKVLLAPSTFGSEDKSPIQRLQEAGLEIIENPFKRKLTKEELLKLLPGVNCLIAGLETLDREVLANSDLKVISRCGAGLSNVDLEAAKELGIIVENTPTAPVNAVAELTIGCLLALLRKVPEMDRALHNNKWEKRIGRELSGMIVAVIGFGNIGRKIGKYLDAFGAKVLVVDPLLSGSIDNFQVVDFSYALKQADVVTFHCSGEKCLLGESEFDLMKNGSYVLNAARGGLIDEEALRKALDNKKITGAWLDTFYNEPYDGPLTEYPQVIMTPHVGSYSIECRKDMEMQAVKNLIKCLEM